MHSFIYLLSLLLTFSPPRLWVFAEIKNDKELLPPPHPTPTLHLPPLSCEDWGQGVLGKTQERRVNDPKEARAAGVRAGAALWAKELWVGHGMQGARRLSQVGPVKTMF